LPDYDKKPGLPPGFLLSEEFDFGMTRSLFRSFGRGTPSSIFRKECIARARG